MKISSLTLPELYARPKITAAVEARIRELEDFTKIAPEYCENVCRLKCKQPDTVRLVKPTETCDVLIVQDHEAPNGKWDTKPGQQEKVIKGILDFMLDRAGGERGRNDLKVNFITLLKCPPTEADFPRGKGPTQITIMKCSPYVLQEIKTLNPKVIVSLSTTVTKALGYTKLSNSGNRGEIVDNKFVMTLHPRSLCMIRQNASGAMWGSDYFEVIVRDFRKAFALARGELKLPKLEDGIEEIKKRITVTRSLEAVTKLVKDMYALPSNFIVSVDTETTGLDRYADDAKLLCIQFGFKDPTSKEYVAVVVPLWHRKNTLYDGAEAWKLLEPWLIDETRPKVLHNEKFDVLYIYATTGTRVQGVDMDTMLLMHDIDSGTQGTFSLKTAAWDWFPELGIAGYESLLPKLGAENVEEEVEE